MDAVVRRRRAARRLDRGRRDLPRRRARHRRDDADVLGSLRPSGRHERPVEGVRDARAAGRLGGRRRPKCVARIWERHDYTTLDAQHGLGPAGRRWRWRPTSRETILARTRRIIRANYPRLEAWLSRPRRRVRLGPAGRRRDRLRRAPPADSVDGDWSSGSGIEQSVLLVARRDVRHRAAASGSASATTSSTR